VGGLGYKAYQRYEDVETFLSHAGRHAVDSLGGMGIPGLTWNSRDAYRTYDKDVKRKGAAAGSVGAAIIAGALATQWRRGGYSAFGLDKSALGRPLARLAIGGMLTGGLVSSVYNASRNAADDGDLRMTLTTVGAFAGAFGGYLIGKRTTGLAASIAAGAGLAVGAGAGYAGGGFTRFAPSQHGQHHPLSSLRPDRVLEPLERPRLASHPALAALRGGWNHFAEEGPLTQGATFGKAWKQRDQVRNRYTTPELAGAMVGDLAALTLMGTGSLAVTLRVLNKSNAKILDSPIARLSDTLSLPARTIGFVKNAGVASRIHQIDDKIEREAAEAAFRGKVGDKKQEKYLRFAQRLHKHKGRWPEALYLFTGAMVGYTVYEAYKGGRGSKLGAPNGPVSAGIAGAGILGATVALRTRAPFIKSLPPKFRMATAFGTSTALWAAIVGVRGSLEQFAGDSAELHRRRKFSPSSPVAGAFVGAGTLAGAVGGARLLRGLNLGGAGGLRLPAGITVPRWLPGGIELSRSTVLGAGLGGFGGTMTATAFAPLVAGQPRSGV